MSGFLRALCEALIWDAIAPLPPPERRQVLDSVTDFLRGQLGALPSPIRGALHGGMIGFRASVLLSERRRFTDLPVERRAALVSRWACGPIAPARQLFRPLRGPALLAVYEEALVQASLGLGRTPGPSTD